MQGLGRFQEATETGDGLGARWGTAIAVAIGGGVLGMYFCFECHEVLQSRVGAIDYDCRYQLEIGLLMLEGANPERSSVPYQEQFKGFRRGPRRS